jgi:hypothetical protein
MRQPYALFTALVLALGGAVAIADAHAPSGAIFTTVEDGSEVNFNHYPSKQAVYLDGGPGPGAPQGAAGLDDGTYVFQVTNPSGKVLLSTDPARCRRFTVAAGVITAVVVAGGCEHETGVDIDHGAVTVQLFPFDDTPNNGGVYKAWAVRVEDFVAGCALLGVANALDVVDCGYNAGNLHGFVPAHSKTDNFKVKQQKAVHEIDTRFISAQSGELLDGRQITWIDTLGASNVKSSYYKPEIFVFHEAHVEAPEAGIHRIVIADQPGCVVGSVHVAGEHTDEHGPQTVTINFKPVPSKDLTIFVDVECLPSP